MNGLVAYGNATGGIRIGGGSSLKLRNSVLVGNVYGVYLVLGTGSSADSLANIDLGNLAASDPGKNTLQAPSTVNADGGADGGDAGASAIFNSGAGVCVQVAAGGGQALKAEGNVWAAATGESVDCSIAVDGGAPTLTTSATCTGAVDYAGAGLATGGTPNTVSVSNCQ